MKLKSWGYEKYLSSAGKKILVAKRSNGQEESKTAFFHLGSEIQSNKMEYFKKREMTNLFEVVSPSGGKSCTVFAKLSNRFL
jgi:hypothetical protein